MKKIYLTVLMLLGLMIPVFLLHGNTEQDLPLSAGMAQKSGSGEQIVITANPAQQPTPEPLKGMDSPMICKLELASIQSKAEKVKANGILTLNSYDVAKDICIFDIMSAAAYGNLGKIETLHKMNDGKFGIRLTLDKAKEDLSFQWIVSALTYCNKNISAENAEEAVRTAIAEGSAAAELCGITIKDSVSLDRAKAVPVWIAEIVHD